MFTVVLSSSNSATRISNGILYPRKRFIPSEKHFFLGLYKFRDRLRCIKSCQESSLCQTVMYDRRKQECSLFSEHVQYGLGRLIDENNEYLITIRIDKDSFKDLHQLIKNKDKQLPAIFSSYQKSDKEICDDCEL